MTKWFILSQGQVSGPFNEDQIPVEASKNPDCLVWTRGELEWVHVDRWDYIQAQHLQKSRESSPREPKTNTPETTYNESTFIPQHQTQVPISQPIIQTPVSSPVAKDNFEKTTSRTLTQIIPESDWKMRIGNEEYSELSYKDLIDQAKVLTDFSNVKVYDRKTKQWRDIYGFEKIINDLGVSRRKHERVPILGTFVGECDRLGSVQGRVVSISEGGFGLSEGKKYQINDQLRGVISSPNLIVQVNCTAEVVYLSPEGVAGLKFKTITEEAQASLIEYVRKFQTVKNKK